MPADKLSTIPITHSASYSLRRVEIQDAKKILHLVRQSGVLDENSCYAYLLLCEHFRETCFVAESDEELAGFVAAYCLPDRPDTVFIWQIGVTPDCRQHGLAKELLRRLLVSPACESVRFLEATVTPSNLPSKRLFKSLADEMRTQLRITGGFSSEHFNDPSHEQETLFRIGPLPAERFNSKENS